MNLAAALLKQIIATSDSEAWGKLRSHYLPTDVLPVYNVISKHYDQFLSLPTFDELKLGTRSPKTLEHIYALERQDVDADALTLLEYLKNDFTQKEIFTRFEKFLDKSVLIDNAEETLDFLSNMLLEVRDMVELEDGEEPLQTMDIFYSDEDIHKFLSLGFNNDYDAQMRFGRSDLIMIGGKRGQGKSLTCANIIANQFDRGNTSQYFTIEMSKRQTLQRIAAVGAQVSAQGIITKSLGPEDMRKVAQWQSYRYESGEEIYKEYLQHGSYEKFHRELVRLPLKVDRQINIIYDSGLTVSKIRAEVEALKNKAGDQFSVVAVDYINKVSRANAKEGVFEWKEQVAVSNELKKIAQDYDVLMLVPYQIDNTGEARFSKGILDAADAAFILDAHTKEDKTMSFKCTKMRNSDDEVTFHSKMDWRTLKIGPQPVADPSGREATLEHVETIGEAASDL